MLAYKNMLAYEINILCDGKDCFECLVTGLVRRDTENAQAVERTVLDNGWTTVGYATTGKHYCPDCIKTLHQTQGTKQQTN